MKTEELMGAIVGSPNFEGAAQQLCEEFVDESVPQMLLELLDKYGVSKAELIVRSNIERGYAYQILNGRRAASRDKLLQMALGMKASLADTQKLLKVSGKGELYPRVKRDAAILFCINKGYSLLDCQLFLDEHGFDMLRE